MSGGHECRDFFYTQSVEHSKRIIDELPKGEYSAEEEEAGFKRISEAFGFYGTLDTVSRYVGLPDKEVLKWSVNEFYTKLKLLSWRAHSQKEYARIMKSKNEES